MLNLIPISLLFVFLLIILFYHRQHAHHKSFISAIVLIGVYLATSFMQMPFLSTLIIIIIALIMAKILKIKITKKVDYVYLLGSIILGFIFGQLFSYLREPQTVIVQIALFALLIALSEELIFRLIILKQLEKDFNFRFALIMQAIFFVLLHMIDLDFVWSHYSNIFFITTYAIALFIFALVAGLMMKGKKGCILYPIVLHFFANLVLFSI